MRDLCSPAIVPIPVQSNWYPVISLPEGVLLFTSCTLAHLPEVHAQASQAFYRDIIITTPTLNQTEVPPMNWQSSSACLQAFAMVRSWSQIRSSIVVQA